MNGLPSLLALDGAQGARIWLASETTDMRCGFDRLAERWERWLAKTLWRASPVKDWVKLPSTRPWGTRSVYFRDPDGNLVDFYTRSKLSNEQANPRKSESEAAPQCAFTDGG
jgi:catechol 2,3-dioxygenase-like lactoylglutathione lyase family enzyme